MNSSVTFRTISSTFDEHAKDIYEEFLTEDQWNDAIKNSLAGQAERFEEMKSIYDQ